MNKLCIATAIFPAYRAVHIYNGADFVTLNTGDVFVLVGRPNGGMHNILFNGALLFIHDYYRSFCCEGL